MEISEHERLQEQLQPNPFLVADGATGDVKLVNETDALRMMAEAGLFHSQVVMNVGRGLDNFAMLTGKADRQFSLKDIATITGTPYNKAHGWLTAKIIIPSIRPADGAGRGKGPRFSWRDAFVAGICGSLRRQGVGLDVLRKISPLFEFETKKKRTARKASTSKRS